MTRSIMMHYAHWWQQQDAWMCNHHDGLDPKQMTKDTGEVTCKICRRMMKRNGIL